MATRSYVSEVRHTIVYKVLDLVHLIISLPLIRALAKEPEYSQLKRNFVNLQKYGTKISTSLRFGFGSSIVREILCKFPAKNRVGKSKVESFAWT